MKQIIVLIICVFIFGCKSELKSKKVDLADINLLVKTDTKIDSVWISNIGQTESFFLPFKDTIKVNFKTKLDDLYNIEFFTENGSKSVQLWLDGSNIIISGTLKDNFVIDSVLNSDLYYKSIDFSKKYRQFIKNDSDSLTIDEFLLNKIRENVKSPFSFAIANRFIYRNQNNKSKIRQLFDELSIQNDTLKNHSISIHEKIENILKFNSLNIVKYKFTDINNKLVSIKLDKSKTYLLDFWFINCPPCIKDHKQILKKFNFFKKHNIEFIGISTDKKYFDWKNYLKKYNYNWKNLREIDSLERITTDMAIWSFPTYLYLDSSGKIKGRFNSFSDFENSINK